MEFTFNASKVLQADASGYAVVDGGNPSQFRKTFAQGITAMRSSSKFFGGPTMNSSPEEQIELIVDKMGAASSKAQRLPAVITSASKLFSSDNRLYMKVEGNTVIGLLKVGKRNLFIRGDNGTIKEIKPLCVLDFYVHESVQRGGHGRALYDFMLAREGARPEKLAYDKPSDKLISFLGKHFGLYKYVPQNNNFVVFDAYWNPSLMQKQAAGETSSRASKPPLLRKQNTQSFESQYSSFHLPPRPKESKPPSALNHNPHALNRRNLGPRKLSNTGLQVLQQTSSNSQTRALPPKRTTSLREGVKPLAPQSLAQSTVITKDRLSNYKTLGGHQPGSEKSAAIRGYDALIREKENQLAQLNKQSAKSNSYSGRNLDQRVDFRSNRTGPNYAIGDELAAFEKAWGGTAVSRRQHGGSAVIGSFYNGFGSSRR